MFAKSKNYALQEIKAYSYPKLHTGKEWYVGFNAFDPVQGMLRRKKIKINHIGKIADRRRYASALIYRLSDQLEKGWNPWIEAENGKAYHTFIDVCDNYRTLLTKMHNDDNLREKTMVDYLSRLKILIEWNAKRRVPITYIYQLDRSLVIDFLDYIYIEKNNTARTRNNYLTWLSTFSSYLVQHAFVKERPTEGIISIKRKSRQKDREVIADKDMIRLRDYLQAVNKHFLLACYILHYTLIRPKEMSWIQLRNISLARQTIFVSGDFSKNRQDAVVTLPAKVIHLMLELNVFSHPDDFFLFGYGFKPGIERRDERQFREFWNGTLRKALSFQSKYKFYSLKDTGITKMLRTCDVLSVRDQARHSSILMTNIYTPHDIQEANELIKNYEGDF